MQSDDTSLDTVEETYDLSINSIKGITDHPKPSDIDYCNLLPENERTSPHLSYCFPGYNANDAESENKDEIIYADTTMRISNGFLYLPYNKELLIRSIFFTRAKRFSIVFNNRSFVTNHKSFYNLNIKNGVEFDPHGSSNVRLLSLFGSLFGPCKSGTNEGIINISPIDTVEEFEEKMKLFRSSKIKKSKNAVAEELEDLDPRTSRPPPPLERQYKAAETVVRTLGNLTISGSFENQHIFTIETNGQSFNLPRFEVIAEEFRGNNSKNIEIPQGLIISFVVVDPRIYDPIFPGELNGLCRGIQRHVKRCQELLEKKNKSKTTSLLTKNEEDDSMKQKNVYQTHCSEITTMSEFGQCLKYACCNPYFNPEANDNKSGGKLDIGPSLDPFKVLNPKVMFDRYDPITDTHEPGTFQFGLYHPNDQKFWTSEEFIENFGKYYNYRYYPVKFYDIERIHHLPLWAGTEIVVPHERTINHPLYDYLERENRPCVYVYSNPFLTLRIPNEDIGSIRLLSAVIPFKHVLENKTSGYIFPSGNILYPIQSEIVYSYNREKALRIEKKILSLKSIVYVYPVLDADITRRVYYGNLKKKNGTDVLTPTYSAENINELRHRELIPYIFEVISPENQKIPELLRAAAKYMEEHDNMIYVDFYNDYDVTQSRNGMEYHHNLTPVGNFYVNYVQYLKKTFDAFNNIPLYNVNLVLAGTQSMLDFDYRVHAAFHGETGTGKSHVMELMSTLLLPNSITKEDTYSNLSFFSKIPKNCKYYYNDDASVQNVTIFQTNPGYLRSKGSDDLPYGFKRQIEKEGSGVNAESYKAAISSGTCVRERMNKNGGTERTEAILRLQRAFLTNISPALLKPSVQSRLYTYPSVENPRAKPFYKGWNIDKFKYNDNIDDVTEGVRKFGIENVLRGFQCFSSVVNHMIHAGAIRYSDDIYFESKVYVERLNKILHDSFQIPIKINLRTEKSIFLCFLRSCTLLRLYVEICSGCFDPDTDPLLQPTSKICPQQIQYIHDRGLLRANEEDTITAFSYFEYMIPSIEYPSLCDWIRKKIIDSGIDLLSMNWNDPDVEIIVDPTNFQPNTIIPKFSNNNFNVNLNIGVPGNLNNMVATPNPNGDTNVPTINTNGGNANYSANNPNILFNASYLNISFKGTDIRSYSMGHMENKIVDEIVREDPYIDKSYIIRGIFNLSHLLEDCDEYEFVPCTGILHGYKIQKTGKTFRCSPLNFVSVDTTKELYSLVIPLSWWLKNLTNDSYLVNPASPVDPEYKRTPLEHCFNLFGYEGCKTKTYVTPGLFLNRPFDFKKKLPDSDHIMKTVFITRPQFDRRICPKLVYPDPNARFSNKKVIFSKDNQYNFEQTCHIFYLLKNYENGYYDFELDKHVDPKQFETIDDFKSEIYKRCIEFSTRYNSTTLHKRFHDMLERRESKVYPDLKELKEEMILSERDLEESIIPFDKLFDVTIKPIERPKKKPKLNTIPPPKQKNNIRTELPLPLRKTRKRPSEGGDGLSLNDRSDSEDDDDDGETLISNNQSTKSSYILSNRVNNSVIDINLSVVENLIHESGEVQSEHSQDEVPNNGIFYSDEENEFT